MHVDTDALRWFQQVADGVTVTEVSEPERVTQSCVSRALARFGSGDRHSAAPKVRTNAADDARGLGFQATRGCDAASDG